MPKLNNSPVVNIVKTSYAMASRDGQSAEITLYGDICESRPIDWWTDEPVPGEFICLDEFLADLETVAGCKDITVRMNSYGGDAGVSNTIHNRLRELARGGASLTCVVDGAAMSGGSLIMCACDTVRANPSSLIMIHKCWSYIWGGYNADELRELAASNDAWDKMQMEIYKRKTGLSEEEILGMMAETTYMTGREALKKGFVDEIIEDAEPVDIAASADGRALFVRGRQMHLAPGMFAPDNIPTVNPEASATVETNTAGATADEGGNHPMANTIQELREEYPELTAQLEAEARAAAGADADARVQAEQDRIREIDAIAGLFSDDVVNAAKYGENACTAQEMAYRAAQNAQAQGDSFLNAMQQDATASNAGKVPSAHSEPEVPAVEEKTPDQLMADARSAVQSWFHPEKED